MSEQLFRIVSCGELAYGFENDETRKNLKKLCKYDDATLDRLFSGEPFFLKNKLPLETARKYKDILDRTGAVCLIEEIPVVTVAPQVVTNDDTLNCPKCQQQQPTGLICQNCGIVFAKFQQLLEREEAAARGEIPVEQEVVSTSDSAANDGLMDRMAAYFAEHQEKAFILKAFLVIALIIFIREYLSGLITLFIILFPVLFLLYVRMNAGSSGQSSMAVLAQHITLMPVMYAEGERKTEGVAWVTYSVIFINVLIYYGFEIHVDPEFIFNNLIFIPYEPNIINVPVSLITSVFLHASDGHLWGNMLFLWAVGTVVEKRIGWKRFMAFYLLAGVIAGLLPALIDALFFQKATHGLGASGAISGVMGLFAVRCYFKSMVFPLPILGVFSLILPISLKVRLNSLVIIGLFFLADLSGGIDQVAGQSSSNVGHWAHIGGMVCGIALGMMFKLGEQAVEERHYEIGSQALDKKGDLFQGEESLRFTLEKNPDNADATILLARLLSKFNPSEEGEALYRKGMDMLIQARPKEVATAFKEYYELYLAGVNPETQFRLASFFHQQKDYEWAARCLELLSDDVSTPVKIREKAMFQCARQMEIVGNFDVARHYYQLFVDTFPASAFTAKAHARLTGN